MCSTLSQQHRWSQIPLFMSHPQGDKGRKWGILAARERRAESEWGLSTLDEEDQDRSDNNSNTKSILESFSFKKLFQIGGLFRWKIIRTGIIRFILGKREQGFLISPFPPRSGCAQNKYRKKEEM